MREPSSNGSRGRYLSGARLDTTTLTLMADASEVRRALAAHPRLALWSGGPAMRGEHPVIVDLFRVSQGRVETIGFDQHRLSGFAGASVGAWCGAGLGGALGSAQGAVAGGTLGGSLGRWLGPVGSIWGTAAGWMAGGAFGALAGLTPGATKGARLGAAAGGRASHQLSDTIGTYDEVLIGVPNVVVRGDGERRYFFVLGMYTDSALARWGDRAFAFGYRKQMATIANAPFTSFRLKVDGRALFSARFADVDPAKWQEVGDHHGHEALFDALEQPLLGITERGRLARSRLDRSFADPAVRLAAPPGVKVTVAATFSPGLAGGTYSLGPMSASRPWGVLHTKGVMSRVTFPAALKARARPRPWRPVA